MKCSKLWLLYIIQYLRFVTSFLLLSVLPCLCTIYSSIRSVFILSLVDASPVLTNYELIVGTIRGPWPVGSGTHRWIFKERRWRNHGVGGGLRSSGSIISERLTNFHACSEHYVEAPVSHCPVGVQNWNLESWSSRYCLIKTENSYTFSHRCPLFEQSCPNALRPPSSRSDETSAIKNSQLMQGLWRWIMVRPKATHGIYLLLLPGKRPVPILLLWWWPGQSPFMGCVLRAVAIIHST